MSDHVIDSCCLLNMYAAWNGLDPLADSQWIWHISTAVSMELLYLHYPNPGGNAERRPLDLEKYVHEQCVFRCAPDNPDEEMAYLDFATQLDDGEAMSLAITKCRVWTLATDDRKAIRLATQEKVKVISTPEIMKTWAAEMSIGDDALRQVLHRIRTFARFAPSPRLPEFDWWVSHETSE